MYLKNLFIRNFRNYKECNLEFSQAWNLLVGPNGIGKTNILEAIYYASTTKSPRTNNLVELIQFKEAEFAINAEFFNDDVLQFENIKHRYSHKNNESQKVIKLNYKKISIFDLIGKILFVYFVPEDSNIVKSESKFRRKFLDFILFQTDVKYKFLLTKYNKILKERNALLKAIKDRKSDVSYLENWDLLLVKYATEIYTKRKNLVDILNQKLFKLQLGLNLKIFYKSCFDKDTTNLMDKILKNRDREIKFGTSLIGIHRDNLNFYLNDQSLKKFGSQGQQRFFILILKILTAEAIFDATNRKPILIFDDVFSELDNSKIKAIIDVIQDEYQVFVSSVSIEGFENYFKLKNIIEVSNVVFRNCNGSF